ncbi:hypothetical protein E8E01_19250 [Methylorubrum populi]|nr:hypothetical protein E8E01_19250 [Methylorubrum populi]
MAGQTAKRGTTMTLRLRQASSLRGGFVRLLRAAGCALLLASSVRAEPSRQTYIALGDSLAYGLQIGKLKDQIAAGAVRAESFNTGYAFVLAAHLRARMPNLNLVDLGCPGESTASFVNGLCGFATTGKPFGTTPLPLHVPYSAAQLTAATDYLAQHRGTISLITLDVGINDLRAVLLACPDGAGFKDCVTTGLPAALTRAEANLKQSLSALRVAAPEARILVGTYYNWLAVDDPDTDRFVEALNRTITTAATEAGAGVVDVFPAFNRTGDTHARLCDLTLYCTPARDLHPSDAGYRVIGDLFAKALADPAKP